MVKSSISECVVDLAIAIQQIPAPTFQEAQRAAFIHDQFVNEGLLDVMIDKIGNVYARLPGKSQAPALVVSAHTDTVFPLNFDLSVVRADDRVAGAGIGDNALGIAGLFGLLWSLQKDEVNLGGDLWLVANVGEEGLGDLCGMQAVVNRFGNHVLAYIVIEGMALGQIYHRGLGVKRYRITVRTQGGHSWVDYGKPSAIHKIAHLIDKLSTLPLPDQPRTSLNVGIISGGTSVNTIAPEASIELDMRSEDLDTLEGLVRHVDFLIETSNRHGETYVQVEKDVIGDRPVGDISKDHPLVRLASSCLEAQGIPANTNIGSTDANIPLSLGLPAICVGLTRGGGAHSSKEFILTGPIAQGIAQLSALVQGAFVELGRD